MYASKRNQTVFTLLKRALYLSKVAPRTTSSTFSLHQLFHVKCLIRRAGLHLSKCFSNSSKTSSDVISSVPGMPHFTIFTLSEHSPHSHSLVFLMFWIIASASDAGMRFSGKSLHNPSITGSSLFNFGSDTSLSNSFSSRCFRLVRQTSVSSLATAWVLCSSKICNHYRSHWDGSSSKTIIIDEMRLILLHPLHGNDLKTR